MLSDFAKGGQIPMLVEDDDTDAFEDPDIVDFEENEFCSVAVAASKGTRPSMEDAHSIVLNSESAGFGVFDGHGGSGCADYIAGKFQEAVDGGKAPFTESGIEQMCLNMDEEFLSTAGSLKSGNLDGSGCTGTFVLLRPVPDKGYTIKIGNVGDSRVVIGRKTGGAEQMTTDHKPVLADERARIRNAGGWVQAGRVDGCLAVSRAFGDTFFKQSEKGQRFHKVVAVPDVTEAELEEGDILALCCDGVFETGMDAEQLVGLAFKSLQDSGGDVRAAAKSLARKALRDGSQDNVTAMVVLLKKHAVSDKKPEKKPAPEAPKHVDAAAEEPTSPAESGSPLLRDMPAAETLHLLIMEREEGEDWGITLSDDTENWNRIADVTKGGPAWRAQVRKGMVLISAAGKTPTSKEGFDQLMGRLATTKSIPLMVRADPSMWARLRRERLRRRPSADGRARTSVNLNDSYPPRPKHSSRSRSTPQVPGQPATRPRNKPPQQPPTGSSAALKRNSFTGSSGNIRRGTRTAAPGLKTTTQARNSSSTAPKTLRSKVLRPEKAEPK